MTADQRFWSSGEKMIFLGEWCLLYDKTSDWSRLNYEVMDYPFDDRAQLYASYKYVDQV